MTSTLTTPPKVHGLPSLLLALPPPRAEGWVLLQQLMACYTSLGVMMMIQQVRSLNIYLFFVYIMLESVNK